MKTLKIPEATIVRLSVYSRFLEHADKIGIITISSGEIAEGVGVSPAQVRKDLAYFGEFGTRGVGYNVKDLLYHTLKILGLSNKWTAIVIGAGNLGTALLSYRGFKERGFNIIGVFDSNPEKIGKVIADLEIKDITETKKFIEKEKVHIGILTIPVASAQQTANLLSEAGIKAILNFAPTVLTVPDDVEVRNVDLAVNLEILTFNMCMTKK